MSDERKIPGLDYMLGMWRLSDTDGDGTKHTVISAKINGEWSITHLFRLAGDVSQKYYSLPRCVDEKCAEESAKSFVNRLTGLEPSSEDLANWDHLETPKTKGQPYPSMDRIEFYEVRSSDHGEVQRKMDFINGQPW